MTTMPEQKTITDTYGREHALPGPFRTLEAMKRANEANGYFFFTPGAMRFFRSRVAPGVIAGRIFITSEQFEDSRGERHERRYTVRLMADGGDTADVSDFQQFATLRAARTYAAQLVARANVSAS